MSLPVCAWCLKERGEPPQPDESHGICPRHAGEVRAELAQKPWAPPALSTASLKEVLGVLVALEDVLLERRSPAAALIAQAATIVRRQIEAVHRLMTPGGG